MSQKAAFLIGLTQNFPSSLSISAFITPKAPTLRQFRYTASLLKRADPKENYLEIQQSLLNYIKAPKISPIQYITPLSTFGITDKTIQKRFDQTLTEQIDQMEAWELDQIMMGYQALGWINNELQVRLEERAAAVVNEGSSTDIVGILRGITRPGVNNPDLLKKIERVLQKRIHQLDEVQIYNILHHYNTSQHQLTRLLRLIPNRLYNLMKDGRPSPFVLAKIVAYNRDMNNSLPQLVLEYLQEFDVSQSNTNELVQAICFLLKTSAKENTFEWAEDILEESVVELKGVYVSNLVYQLGISKMGGKELWSKLIEKCKTEVSRFSIYQISNVLYGLKYSGHKSSDLQDMLYEQIFKFQKFDYKGLEKLITVTRGSKNKALLIFLKDKFCEI